MEILAPAGNIDALKAAVYSYADAVYLGVDKLNARLKADNFTTQNLADWVEFCHVYGVKVYLTVNTLIKDSEIELAREVITCARDAKVDAFIIADIAMCKLCRQIAPNIALHASTQMGIHNLFGAKFIESLGFKRVVLSREATLVEIESIKNNTNLEIEYFAHGALCVAFSGGCLLSSLASGNSGNRGRCLQLCRKEYSNSLNDKIGYLLSPKDQCLIDKITELKKAGVDCIKIEGRMRSPEYVSTTAFNYRNATLGNLINAEDRYKLNAVFNRGSFTKGYCFENTSEIMFPYVQGNYGAPVANVISSINNGINKLVTIKLTRNMPNKFGAKIIMNKLEIDGGEINLLNINGNIAQFVWKTSLPIGAKVHATNDSSITVSAQRKLNVSAEYSAICDERLSIRLICGNIEIVKISDFVCQNAKSQALTHDQIAKQIAKSGDTCFEITKIKGVINGNIFIPNGVINELRRDALSELYGELISCYNNETPNVVKSIAMTKVENIANNILEVDCLPNIINNDFTYVLGYNNIESIMKTNITHNNIYIKLPKIAMNRDCVAIIDLLNKIPNNIGIYADNYYAIQIAKEFNRTIIYGFGLNIFNNIAAEFYGQNYCLSPELSIKELKSFNQGYLYTYGYLPIMTFAHCPYQLVTGNTCDTCGYGDFEYADDYGSYKISRTMIKTCQFTLDNSSCHDLRDKNIKYRYYDLRRLSVNEIDKFIQSKELPMSKDKTLGRYTRGVE